MARKGTVMTKCYCGRMAIIKDKKGIPVCSRHRNTKVGAMKCACGKYLRMNTGRYGTYFTCSDCGNINLRKAMELNPKTRKELGHDEVTIRSDQLDYVY